MNIDPTDQKGKKLYTPTFHYGLWQGRHYTLFWVVFDISRAVWH